MFNSYVQTFDSWVVNLCLNLFKVYSLLYLSLELIVGIFLDFEVEESLEVFVEEPYDASVRPSVQNSNCIKLLLLKLYNIEHCIYIYIYILLLYMYIYFEYFI
jgi:hypothetical protein